MRCVLQRVRRAEVRIQGDLSVSGQIEAGLVVLLGIGQGDQEEDAVWMLDKITGLRIFPEPGDDNRNINRAIREVGGGLLIISQFTLFADCRKGRRPSFTDAMPPGPAEALYERFVALARQTGLPVGTGRFGAMMDIELVNDGPVTLWLDSRAR